VVTVLSAPSNVKGSRREMKDGWSPVSIDTASETKNRSNFPRSAVCAIESMTGQLALLVKAPS
jgi:hypothetical protein